MMPSKRIQEIIDNLVEQAKRKNKEQRRQRKKIIRTVMSPFRSDTLEDNDKYSENRNAYVIQAIILVLDELQR